MKINHKIKPVDVDNTNIKKTLLFKDAYYLKKDCVKIGYKYYHPEDSAIIYNDSLEKYEKQTKDHLFGIFVNKNKVLSFGNFKKNVFTANFEDFDKELKNFIDSGTSKQSEERSLEKSDTYFVENILVFMTKFPNDCFADPDKKNTYSFLQKRVPTEGYPYEVAEVPWGFLLEKSNRFYEQIVPENIKNLLVKWGSLLTKTIGVEYETSKGYLSDNFCNLVGLVKLRDGSLKGGFEYSTIPFYKEKAIFFNIFIPYLLGLQHDISNRCSLHIHLGGFPRDKKKLLSLHLMLYRLQQEINEFIPPYRKTQDFLQQVTLEAGKDYCADLPSLSIDNENLQNDWLKVFDKV
jgi:hypothetical protein